MNTIERMNQELALLRQLYVLTTDVQLKRRMVGRGQYLKRRVELATAKLTPTTEEVEVAA